jgi:hypothetical protein
MRSILVLIFVVATAGCPEKGEDDRPATWREVCEQNAIVDCAFEARQDVCAGRPAESSAVCETAFTRQCCSTTDCAAEPTFTAATFGEFEACRDAVVGLACSALDTKPSACEGVIK